MALKYPRTDPVWQANPPREIPIRLPDDAIRGLLNGAVTRLRFPVQGNPRFAYACVDRMGELNRQFFVSMPDDATRGIVDRCPYGDPGDVLWIREDWAQGQDGSPHYRVRPEGGAQDVDTTWNNAAGMARSASRLSLGVLSTSVARLHAMARSDARAHGHVSVPGRTALDSFRETWDASYSRAPWRTNPWVWVVDVARPSGEMLASPA